MDVFKDIFYRGDEHGDAAQSYSLSSKQQKGLAIISAFVIILIIVNILYSTGNANVPALTSTVVISSVLATAAIGYLVYKKDCIKTCRTINGVFTCDEEGS